MIVPGAIGVVLFDGARHTPIEIGGFAQEISKELFQLGKCRRRLAYETHEIKDQARDVAKMLAPVTEVVSVGVQGEGGRLLFVPDAPNVHEARVLLAPLLTQGRLGQVIKAPSGESDEDWIPVHPLQNVQAPPKWAGLSYVSVAFIELLGGAVFMIHVFLHVESECPLGLRLQYAAIQTRAGPARYKIILFVHVLAIPTEIERETVRFLFWVERI